MSPPQASDADTGLIILSTYFVEVAQFGGLTVSCSLTWVMIAGPLPFYLAQLVVTLAWSAADVMFFIGGSISLCKILFVSHFDFIFSRDPELLGHLVLCASILVGCVPHWVIYIYRSTHGLPVAPVVAFYIGEPMRAETSPMMIYGSFVILFYILMLIAAMVFIQHYVKRKQQQAAVLEAERNMATRRTLSLVRILFGSSSVALVAILNLSGHATGLTAQLPVAAFLSVLAVCLMLIFLALDENVSMFIREKIVMEIVALRSYILSWRRPSTLHPA